MDREIEFIAWNKQTQQLVDLKKITPLALGIDADGVFIPFVDYIIPLQYTGIKDCKGNKIFEASLVKDDGGFIWIVKYIDGAFWFVNPADPTNRNTYDWLVDNKEWEGTEVAGHFFTHPDLVKP